MSNEKIIRVNGVDLCVETFGDGPAVLLIGGTSSSMLWWEDEFCARLAAAGRYVIRYDNRDTGRSVHYPLGKPGYTGEDLADDAVGVLDALGVDRAHVVGLSMGGGIGMEIMRRKADRVASLTLIATTTGGDDDLPGVAERMRTHWATAVEPDWSDRAAVVDYLVAEFRAYAGTLPFDEAGIRATAERDVDRTIDIAVAMTNHSKLHGEGESLRPLLAKIAVPTLVLHGTEDPLFPLPHGEMLAREIPGARLVPMVGAGHELPRTVWDAVIPELVAHTAA